MNEEKPLRLFKAWVESVYDGDTFTVVVEIEPCLYDDEGRSWDERRPDLFVEVYSLESKYHGSNGIRERIKVRLLGIDAPEVRGKEEKEDGLISAHWVRGLLLNLESVNIEMVKRDSFGRWLCNVWYGPEDRSLAESIIEAGMASRRSASRGMEIVEIMSVPW